MHFLPGRHWGKALRDSLVEFIGKEHVEKERKEKGGHCEINFWLQLWLVASHVPAIVAQLTPSPAPLLPVSYILDLPTTTPCKKRVDKI